MKQKERALLEGFSTNVRSSGGHFAWYCLTLVCKLWINLNCNGQKHIFIHILCSGFANTMSALTKTQKLSCWYVILLCIKISQSITSIRATWVKLVFGAKIDRFVVKWIIFKSHYKGEKKHPQKLWNGVEQTPTPHIWTMSTDMWHFQSDGLHPLLTTHASNRQMLTTIVNVVFQNFNADCTRHCVLSLLSMPKWFIQNWIGTKPYFVCFFVQIWN